MVAIWFGMGYYENPILPIKEMDLKGFEIFKVAGRTAEASLLLLEQGHQTSALMLTFAAIDQAAWLSIENEKSCSADFIGWVDKYMLSKNPLPCTAKELWEARNALLHMGTAESAAIRKDPSIRKIYYTFGKAECTRNDSADVVFLNVNDLVAHFLTAALWFVEELETDAQKLAVAQEKLGRTMTSRGLTPGQ